MLEAVLEAALSVAANLAFAFPALLFAQRQSNASDVRNTVLVRGAFADGDSTCRSGQAVNQSDRRMAPCKRRNSLI